MKNLFRRPKDQFQASNDEGQPEREMIWTAQAASIFGVHPETWRRWMKKGRHPHIRREKYIAGMKYDFIDCLRTAYPTAGPAELVLLMKQYREEWRRKRSRKNRKGRQPEQGQPIEKERNELQSAEQQNSGY